MTEHKFTDEEIIKGLKCCLLSNSHQEEECDKCPLYETPLTICQNLMAYYALDLINRQKEEIEELRHKYELAVAEREANVKGFADSIKTYYAHIDKTVGALINYTIDQKLKEFLGEGGGKENG